MTGWEIRIERGEKDGAKEGNERVREREERDREREREERVIVK